jgi:hypothetical protein
MRIDGGYTQSSTSQTSVPQTQPQTPVQTNDVNSGTSKVGDQFMRASQLRWALLTRLDPGGPGGPGGPPVNPGPATFDQNGPNIGSAEPRADFTHATPQEAAAYVKFYAQASLSLDPEQAKTDMFTRILMEHKGDAKWIQGYFKAFGADESSKLISQAFSPGQYSTYGGAWPKSDIDTRQNVVRDALTTLANAGMLNQADMNKLVSEWSSNGNFNPNIATDLFGKMSYQNQAVKNMFFTAAANQALHDPNHVSNDLAAAATTVLATTDSDNEVQQLEALRTKFGSDAFKNFIKGSMSADKMVLASNGDSQETTSLFNQSPLPMERFGNVSALLMNAAFDDTRDSFNRNMPVAETDLKALRTDMFDAAASALTNNDVRKNFQSDTIFKDGMSQIFMEDFDNIINSGLGSNGAGFDDVTFQPALERFFQVALLTPPPGDYSSELSSFLSNKITDLASGTFDKSPQAEQQFEAKFGRTRVNGVEIAGGLLGMLTDSVRAAKDQLNADAAAQADAVKLIADIAFGFIPGIGSKLGDSAAEIFLKNIIGPVDSKIRDSLKAGAVDQAKQYFAQQLKDQLKGLSPEAMIGALYNQLHQTIPTDGFLLQSFDDGYLSAVNSQQKIAGP